MLPPVIASLQDPFGPLEKTGPAEPVAVGEPFMFVVTIPFVGNATNVTLADYLPEGVTVNGPVYWNQTVGGPADGGGCFGRVRTTSRLVTHLWMADTWLCGAKLAATFPLRCCFHQMFIGASAL